MNDFFSTMSQYCVTTNYDSIYGAWNQFQMDLDFENTYTARFKNAYTSNKCSAKINFGEEQAGGSTA
jgi:hypothetical protein